VVPAFGAPAITKWGRRPGEVVIGSSVRVSVRGR
jgi:hypothetical protein